MIGKNSYVIKNFQKNLETCLTKLYIYMVIALTYSNIYVQQYTSNNSRGVPIHLVLHVNGGSQRCTMQ